MSNEFYTPTGNPGTLAFGSSQLMRTEFAAIASGFQKVESSATLSSTTIISGSISTTVISGGSIVSAAISGGTISGAAVSAGSVVSAAISGGTISGAVVSAGSVVSAAISGGTISGATISGATISGGSVVSSVLSNSTLSGTLTGVNIINNSSLANMASSSLKGNVTGGSAVPSDLGVPAVLGLLKTTMVMSVISSVDINALGDTQFNISLPSGFTKWMVRPDCLLRMFNSTIANILSPLRFEVWTGPGATGVKLLSVQGTLISAGTTPNVDRSADHIVAQGVGTNPMLNYMFNVPAVYFRVTTVQGAPGTIDVLFYFEPIL